MSMKKDYWRTSKWPTMEFTTSISPKGCVINCAYCPQRTLEKIYHAHKGKPKTLSLENFITICDKIPQEVRITMSGFTEPWLNRECTKMVEYAHYKGHPLSAFTTGVGMTLDDVERLKDMPWALGPNGGFTLHLPDAERIAEHPLTPRLRKVYERLKELEGHIQAFYIMSMGPVHEFCSDLWSDVHIPPFWNRAGNLVGEATMKPALEKVMDRVHHAPQKGPSTCGCIEHVYHQVCLPNGDLSVCCQDYSLEKILGNILEEDYDDLMPPPLTTYDICSRCENGVSPSQLIKEKNIEL